MFELSPEVIALLIGAAFFGGFIDSIAGGGGLITVPVLLLSGMSPLQALSTNKVQATFGAATAALSYAISGQVDLRHQIGAALLSCIAGVFGALLVAWIPTDGMQWILSIAMLGISAFFAFRKGLDDTDRTRRISPALFTAGFVPLIGFYDGLIGPGTGSFFMLGFVTLAGYGVLRATAHTKLLNFASNLGALAVFIALGAPVWGIGLAMGVAQIAGARLGARLAVRIGARIIKPLLVTTSSLLAIKLIYDLL